MTLLPSTGSDPTYGCPLATRMLSALVWPDVDWQHWAALSISSTGQTKGTACTDPMRLVCARLSVARIQPAQPGCVLTSWRSCADQLASKHDFRVNLLKPKYVEAGLGAAALSQPPFLFSSPKPSWLVSNTGLAPCPGMLTRKSLDSDSGALTPGRSGPQAAEPRAVPTEGPTIRPVRPAD